MNCSTTRMLLLFLCSYVCSGNLFSQNVNLFEHSGDIGTNVKSGSTTFIAATNQYVISGAGYNVWADHDEFQYAYKKMHGDFICYARAEFLGTWVNYHRKVG